MLSAGKRAIEQNMDARRDDLNDKGYSSRDIEEIINKERKSAQMELYDDVYGKVDEQCVRVLNRYLEYFSEENWNKMNADERKDALNTLAISSGDAFRTEIKGARFYEGSRSNRGYYNGDGYLYLNQDVLSNPSNRIDALDTIFHEGRHAFQIAAVEDHVSCSVDEAKAISWENNFPPNYIRQSPHYFTQPIEADAYSFAEDILKGGEF